MLETLVGLHVTDEEGYALYRSAMKPILQSMGGGFRYDFKLSEVCDVDIAEKFKNSLNQKINRVFIIYFPNIQARDDFFRNEKYLEIKNKYFEPSVEYRTTIAQWEID